VHPRMCIYIYHDMKESLPALPCIASSFRRTSRALTQLYEQALRPVGIRATQFTILQTLSLAGEVSQGQLGEMLAMDSTTLTRTLVIMGRHGWIAERRGEDRRERWLRLAKTGETQLNRALPSWEKVQSHLRDQLGEHAWKNLMQLTNQVTTLATNRGD
jgi:DNA-binding MarR family transcriptional regulator